MFVEPDATGNIIEKVVHFEATMLERTKQLLAAMWNRVMTLDMPDTSFYGDSMKDIRAFEDALLGKG
ncbi:hypothetical protein IPL68_06425 [Candidatus Saccharibacteria bacterium]|nr:MAG: hypothetical protein IPL68_06425 [Candidatus Saccharibacteria bacterium]